MRPLTIELDDDVYSFLEIRSAMDDLRIKEGVENFLTELAMAKKERREILFLPESETNQKFNAWRHA